jgi:hypothetical protein
MTEGEWLSCDCVLPMLIFLRCAVTGEHKDPLKARIVSGYGNLFAGPGQMIRTDQCRRFILRCSESVWDLALDEPSRAALAAYRRYVLDGAPRDEFFQACFRIHDVVSQGGSSVISHLASGLWTDDPAGAAIAAGDIACSVANAKAKESVAISCAGATEEDWFAWGFFGGPPDALWQATRKAEEQLQANLLRRIVGNPFHERAAQGGAWR